jgi:hypothetical protein
MNCELPLPGLTLPVRCAGSISFRDAWFLCVKSPRSALLLIIVWFFVKVRGILSNDLAEISSTLREWSILEKTEKVHGFLAYTPRDLRGRSYIVILKSNQSLFVKIGPDVINETIPESTTDHLHSAGFLPHLPILHKFSGNIGINFYPYLKCRNFQKTRLSDKQCKKISTTLNHDSNDCSIPLKTFLKGKKISPTAASIFKQSVIKDILFNLSNFPVMLGKCHGDLMSPNIFKISDDMSKIVILDWEGYKTEEPLVIDKIGGQHWAIIVKKANEVYKINHTNPDKEMIEVLLFMVIMGWQGFKPALSWLSQLPKYKSV